ncbi:hypothetical protein [Methylobacterium sp. JK268]
MTPERCLVCGEHAVEERVDAVTLTRRRRSATYADRRMVCAACGNVSYRGAQVSGHEVAVAAAERGMEVLLSVAELCAIRSKYRLRQADMEQILSTGPKTWTRWERDKITQIKAVDKFIRAIAGDLYLARRLMREAGVDNPEADEVFARIERDERLRARAALRAELGRRVGIDDPRLNVPLHLQRGDGPSITKVLVPEAAKFRFPSGGLRHWPRRALCPFRCPV